MSRLVTNSIRTEEILLDLIYHGPSTADVITQRLNRQKHKTYEYLKHLRESGLVTTSPRLYGKTIYLVDKEGVLQTLANLKLRLEDDLRKITRVKQEIIKPTREFTFRISEEIWIGPPDEAISQTLELMSEAKKRICVSTYAFSWLTKVEKVLFKKGKEGKEIHVLMSPSEEEFLISVENQDRIDYATRILRKTGAKIYYVKGRVPFRGIIVDNKICLFMMFEYDKEKDKNVSKGYCICSNNAIVNVFQDYWSMCCQGIQVLLRRSE